MASMSVFVYGVLLFFVLCNVAVRGIDLSNSTQFHIIQGENLSASVNNSLEEKDGWYKHGAGYYTDGRFHGVSARINLWAIPDVQPQSVSAAYIGAANHGKFIAAGFHVFPQLYKDNELHFFTYWTDGASTCYNTQCKFVVSSETNTYPGQAIAPPLSVYGGEQRHITLRIKKDEQTGDWSLYREDLGGPIGGMTLVGWWPSASIGDFLSDEASRIGWRGEVLYQFDERSPSMGSGHYPNEYEGHAAYFEDIFGFDINGRVEYYKAYRYVDKPGCYDVSSWFYDTNNRYHFFYGGPSGCAD